MKKDVIYCPRSNKYFFDDGIVRTWEKVVLHNVSLKEAKQKYPEVIT